MLNINKLSEGLVRRAQRLIPALGVPRAVDSNAEAPSAAPVSEPVPELVSEPVAEPAPAPEQALFEQRDVCVEREDGSTLRLLVLSPKGEHWEALPGVLWLHGGGYVSGMSTLLDGGMPGRLIDERPCVIVCPDYRLAQEIPWPGGLEDAHAGLVWLRNHAAELGVADDKLMVGGESAGGGMAVALCLYERDLRRAGRDGVAICFHMPLYPMLDDRPTPSSEDNHDSVWDSSLNRQAWDTYLAGLDRTEVSPYAAPARATSYADMPAGVTFVGTLEPLLDETVTYVERMRADGVHMDFRLYRNCSHAFDLLTDGPQTRGAREFVLRKFAAACDERHASQS